jgi:hypothetical protein
MAAIFSRQLLALLYQYSPLALMKKIAKNIKREKSAAYQVAADYLRCIFDRLPNDMEVKFPHWRPPE